MTESIKPATEKHSENTTSIYTNMESGVGRGLVGEGEVGREFQTVKPGSICSQVKLGKCGKKQN